MRKAIILLLCCGVLVGMAGCGGNTAPPATESPPTTISKIITAETPAEPIPPTTAVEVTEKEKEPTPTESKYQAAEATVTATEPITEKPKEEIKPTAPTKPAESSAAENIEPKIEETPKEEEIYAGIQWPEVDPVEIERLIIEKINTYRITQGDVAAMMLPGLTEVARYRAKELTTNFSHTDIRDVCKELKYGEFVDMTLYGMTAEDSYYQGYNREAIGMGEWFGTAESMSDRIADGFHHSKGHWSYVGSSKYPYIAVGVTKVNDKWYVCICMSKENYGG